jgi:membrane protein YqaA with SNARE-associated domain
MEALATLFATSFAAATLIPLPSEAALFAYVHIYPDRAALGFMATGRLARYIAVASLA